jgi:hypothetical protein
MAPAVATYEPRDPSHTVLYRVIAEHLETFLASLATDPNARGLPAYVQREFYDYLQCGILAHGFLRLGCDTCKKEVLLAFSCKRRGFCPSCVGRPYGPNRGPPGRTRHPLGADATMGGVRARPLTILDVIVKGLDGDGSYDYPHHGCAVLRQPSGQTRRRAAKGSTGVGNVYPVLWQCHESASPFSLCLL